MTTEHDREALVNGREALIKILIDMQRLLILGRDAEVADCLQKLNAALRGEGGEQTAEPVAFLKQWKDEQGRVYTTLDWTAGEPDGRTPRPLLEFESLPLYAHHAPACSAPDEALVELLRNKLFDNPDFRNPGNPSYREGYADGLNDMADEFKAAIREYIRRSAGKGEG